MGDGLKLSKDKRHRSSSSLAGVSLEGTRSERKLNIRGSILEVDDQFVLAESRCDELQEKIDLVKVLKKKRKLKKRSMTRVNEQPIVTEHVPFIAVRTQPKKKVSQQAARLRRLEGPPVPARGYLDPTTVEQHRMLGQVWDYGQNRKFNENIEYPSDQRTYSKTRGRRARADGDGTCSQGVQITTKVPLEVACGEDDDLDQYSETELFDPTIDEIRLEKNRPLDNRTQTKTSAARRRAYSRDNNLKEGISAVPKWIDSSIDSARLGSKGNIPIPQYRRHPQSGKQTTQQNQLNIGQKQHQHQLSQHQPEERPVVELFNKSRAPLPESHPPQSKKEAEKRNKKPSRITQKYEDQVNMPTEDLMTAASKKESHYQHPRRVKYRSRRYEMPTVASQMKQADIRYHCGIANRANIPFVVSKSTSPSHNIGVNIQQVLNGLKIQQPLSGIPLTIAHHMGLGHVPTYGTKSATTQPSLKHREINAIKLGRRLLMLPSYKYMSYNRLLTLYREGEGMVPRFLRAISRPHYFYTSMYNLATNREDLDGATSKGHGGSHETKQQLAEYAGLYREFELVEKRIKEGNGAPEHERRREELLRELAAREELIRKLVQDSSLTCPGEFNLPNVRTTLSTAEDGFRHSSFKVNIADQAQ